MSTPVTVTKKIHFTNSSRGKLTMVDGPKPTHDVPRGAVPRLTRLMALAVKFERLLTTGGVYDQAELAEVGHVSRARVTQIMNLLWLAPDIQEAILNLPLVTQGKDPITERQIRPIIRELDWKTQRKMWDKMMG